MVRRRKNETMYFVAQIETKFDGIKTVVRETKPTGPGVHVIHASKRKISAVRYAHNFSDDGVIIGNTHFSDEEVADLLQTWEDESRCK